MKHSHSMFCDPSKTIGWSAKTLVAVAALFSASSTLAAAPSTAFIFVRPATDAQCSENQLDEDCFEICRGEGETPVTCVIAQTIPPPVLKLKPNTEICSASRCVPAALILNQARTHTKKVVVFDTSKAEACASTREAGTLLNTGTSASSTLVPALIPAVVWELFRPDCCSDCWAVHRAAGLDCSFDAACCMGACGIQPGCGGAGGVGGDIPGGGPGDDGEPCAPSYSVVDATISVDGATCNFTGTVNPTYVDGVCTDLQGDGFTSGCYEDVGGVCLEIPEIVVD